MSWVRIDDGFCEHPKILEAGPEAAWLHVRALCYCSRHLTDGFVSVAALRSLGGARAKRLAAVLVKASVWDAAEGGWKIHDYLDYQPSRAKVLQDREAARERMRRRGRGSGDVRANSAETSSEVRTTFGDPVPSRPIPSPRGTSSGGRAGARQASPTEPQRARADAMVEAASGPWKQVLSDLSQTVPLGNFVVWLKDTALEVSDGMATVLVPNDFARDFLAGHEYRGKIAGQLEQVLGRAVEVKFRVNSGEHAAPAARA